MNNYRNQNKIYIFVSTKKIQITKIAKSKNYIFK